MYQPSFLATAIGILTASKVKEGETVLIISCPEIETTRPGDHPIPVAPPGYIETLRNAAECLGARCTVLEVPRDVYLGIDDMEEHAPGSGELMKGASMIINSPNFPAPRMTTAALQVGARALQLHQDWEVHKRLFPTQEKRIRGLVCAGLFEKAEIIRVTTEAGTDITCSRKGRKVHLEVGIADEPGRWDNAAAGQVMSAPVETSLNGTLVIEKGSGIAHLGYVTDDIVCTIQDGCITQIEGGAWAILLKQWFSRWNHKKAYMISHIGWGLDERCDWTKGHFIDSAQDWESLYGNLLIGFGYNLFDTPSRYSGLGGQNDAPSHIDFILKTVDFYLDGELMVSGNRYVHKGLKSVVAPIEPPDRV